ncbi:hypothetical protein F8388_017578, partial [Cannabis sativa]
MSHNYFTGALPSEYMSFWYAMKDFKITNLTYMKAMENLTLNTNAIAPRELGESLSWGDGDPKDAASLVGLHLWDKIEGDDYQKLT